MFYLVRSYSTLHSAYMRRQSAADLTRELDSAQKELSTGTKSDVYKSLGVASAEALNLHATLDQDEAQIAANGLLGHRLDTMAETLGSIRDTIQDTLQIAVANKSSQLGTVTGLQKAARAALDSIIAQANASHAGVQLFAGIEGTGTTLQPWGETNATSGLKPADVMNAMLAGGLPDAATANARIADLRAAFGDTSGTAGWNFEETFYNGAATGQPRQAANVGDGSVINYGVQANDQGFRDVLQGLAMLATVDPAQISDQGAYEAWMNEAVNALSSGSTKLLDAETQLGAQSAQVQTSNNRMQDRMDLYKSRLLNLEGIDSYEAATRISLLQTQLQASYAVTARLSQLSFLNYL